MLKASNKENKSSQPVVRRQRYSTRSRAKALIDPEALRWREISWTDIPYDYRVRVLPFLSIQDNGMFNIAMAQKEDREHYLFSHQIVHLPAYDNHVYTDSNDFKGLRWVLNRGIKLGRLQINYGWETDRDQVLWCVTTENRSDIAREYVKINTDLRDVLVITNVFYSDDNEEHDAWDTTLIRASFNGCMDVVTVLIANGADLNRADDEGYTPIYWASFYGHLQIVQALIAAGADAKKVANYGGTPMYAASARGHLEVVQALIATGADVNQAVTIVGETPICCASFYGRLEIVQALIAAGADVNHTDNNGDTPVYAASKNGHLEVVQALIAVGATPLP
jgi:ankyrin repeat protein